MSEERCFGDLYRCRRCEAGFDDASACIEHIVTAHGLAAAVVRGAKGRMIAHTDADEWYEDQWVYFLDGQPLLQHDRRFPRSAADRGFWKMFGSLP